LIQVLVDENVPVSVMEWLKNRGLNAERVSKVGLEGVKDEEVEILLLAYYLTSSGL